MAGGSENKKESKFKDNIKDVLDWYIRSGTNHWELVIRFKPKGKKSGKGKIYYFPVVDHTFIKDKARIQFVPEETNTDNSKYLVMPWSMRHIPADDDDDIGSLLGWHEKFVESVGMEFKNCRPDFTKVRIVPLFRLFFRFYGENG